MVAGDNKSFENEANGNVLNKEDIDLKELNENYDLHLDTYLPDYLHRGDITTVNRFLGYHDAMMATCGTFLVLPLRNLNKMVTEEDVKHGHLPHGYIVANTLAEYLDKMSTEFIMFFLGFLIICTIWESNNVRTIVSKRMDDFLVLLGILQMCAIIVLPFSMALQGNYPNEDVAVVMTTVTLIIIDLLELLMVIYAFSSPRLLHLAMKDWTQKDRRRFLIILCIKPVFDIIIVGIAGACALLDYKISWVLFAFLVLWPLARKSILYGRRRLAGETKREQCKFFWFFTKGNISKERVEAFTDAAVAIIACVLILDITVEEFPTTPAVKKNGLVSVLKHMEVQYLVFFGTYLAVSFLWYINHTVLHLFHTIDTLSLYLQKIFLAFLCMAPISNHMIVKFGSKGSRDTQIAVLWSSMMIFVASLTQFLMYMWGNYRKTKLIHKWATCYGRCPSNKKQSLYIFCKTLTIPFWSFISIFGHFANGHAPGIIALVVFCGTIVTFVLLKFIFLNHIGKEGLSRFERGDQAVTSEMKLPKEMEEEISQGKYTSKDDLERNEDQNSTEPSTKM